MNRHDPRTFSRGQQRAEVHMAIIPIMQIRHNGDGQWFVAARWPDGHAEDIRGFETESEANEWIANELQAWLDRRKDNPDDRKRAGA